MHGFEHMYSHLGLVVVYTWDGWTMAIMMMMIQVR